MLRLCSASQVLGSISRAHDVEVYSYTLHPGPVLAALESAARRGTRVRVRLEGAPFPDRGGSLARYNRRLAATLRGCGADAGVLHDGSDAGPPLHAKAIVADGRLFLDDRNFNAGDFILADDSAADATALRDAVGGKPNAAKSIVAFDKRDAVENEAQLIGSTRRGNDVIVVTETFGYGPVYSALDALAKRGDAPRLIVSNRSAHANPRERAALAHLAADGVRVRVGNDSEKFAVAGGSAWIGSANASPAYPLPDTVDWGATTRCRSIVGAVGRRAEAVWTSAKPLRHSI